MALQETHLKLLASDPRYLIESAFSILDKDSILSPLIFNATQNDYWPKITDRDIVLKSRKMGFTTIRLARLIAKCYQMPNRRCIVVSADDEATKRILGRATEMIKNCVFDLNAKVFNETIRFPSTGSSIWIGTAGSKAFGRGDDITDYLFTEFAWWERPDLITGVEEACVTDSEGCIESTAHGFGTPFHKLWTRASSKIAGVTLPDGAPKFYTPHFYGWWQDKTLEADCPEPLPSYDDDEEKLKERFGVTDRKLLWRRLKISSMFDPNLFDQEYPDTPEAAFLTAGMMVFDPSSLRKHEETARKALWVGEIKDHGEKVHLEPSQKGRLTVWLTPEPRAKYLISADIAAGMTDGDYSVADVYDINTHEQVAQWYGHIAPDLFGDILTLLGVFYNFAVIVPEVNNHGLTTCTRINDNEYPNLHRRDDGKGGNNLGWYTSPGRSGTRIELINTAREAVRDYQVKINSPITISECRTFITLSNGDMDAQGGAHKDSVISLGIGAVMLKKIGYIPEVRRESFKDRLGFRPDRPTRFAQRSFKGGYQ